MKGYSNDRYIIDQDVFTDYKYRGCPLCHNGCGPIAIYNMFRYLNIERDLNDIISNLESMYIFNIPGPTTNKVMGNFLRHNINNIYEAKNKKESYNLIMKSKTGIIRYNESGIPHLVCYIKQGKNLYRFFNVEDGFEDYITDLDTFFKRILPGFTYTYAVL